MGSEVTAKCKCGVDASIMIGSGFDGPRPSYFPCLCEKCRAVVQVDVLAKRKQCPQCKSTKVIPYDDPTLSESQERTIEDERRELRNEFFRKKVLATDRNYRCPQCGQMALRFTYTDMCWD